MDPIDKNIEEPLLVHEQQTDSNEFECKICYCSYELTDPEFSVKMLSCGHSFCSICFSEYYKSLIVDQNRHNSLKCP